MNDNGDLLAYIGIIWNIDISHMLHGAGIFTYIWDILRVAVGKYSSTMEHMGIRSYLNLSEPLDLKSDIVRHNPSAKYYVRVIHIL